MLFNIQGAKANLKKVSVTNAEGPPVPIPNTEVKLCSGDNTLWETAREDSSMLTQGKGNGKTVPQALKKTECERNATLTTKDHSSAG